MELKANVNFANYEAALQVVDAHTAGEFCRMVIGGFPEPEGNTMIEKKKWMEENYDHVRTALMLEPRGHHDMFGGFLCKPVQRRSRSGSYLYGYRRISEHVRTLYNRFRYCCNRSRTR